MKTYTAIERQQTSIPIAEVLGQDGSLKIFPEVRERGYFELDLRKGELVVVSGKFVGHIPLNETVLVDVRPKVGIRRLGEILERAHEPLQCLDFYRRAYKTNELSAESIFEVLVRAFLSAVRTIVDEGVLKDYLPIQEHRKSIRGRVNEVDTARKLHARGLFNQVACRFHDFGVDNPMNRLIKYALWYAGRHLVASGASKPLRAQLSELYSHFEAVPLDMSRRFVDDVRSFLATRRLSILRSYYIEACDTALAIVSENGLDLLAEGQDVHLASFLVNMENVFEQYVRNVMRDASAILNKGLVVLDGNKKEGRGWFYSDSMDHEAKPDLVLKKNARTMLIGDVKYKPRISEHDRYQIVAHAVAFDAPRAVLVLPCLESTETRITRLGKVGNQGGVQLYLANINLEAEDLSAEEGRFAELVAGICEADGSAPSTGT